MQWLYMSNGAYNVFRIGWGWIKDNPAAAVHPIINSIYTISDPNALFSQQNRGEFADLLLPLQRNGDILGQNGEQEELADQETREAYEKTVSYLGSIRKAIKADQRDIEICRWRLAFAVLVPRKMLELGEGKEPRALVVLAYYFALASFLARWTACPWWIGGVGKREIEGIQKYLPAEWQDLMAWPLAPTGIT